jgi:hypothetical protein
MGNMHRRSGNLPLMYNLIPLTKGFQATLALKKKRQQNSERTVYGFKIHSLDIYNEWI